MNLPDSLRRGIRTFVQGFIGIVLLQAVALATDANDGSIDADLWRRTIFSALVAGFIAVVSWLQNYLEDAGTIPSVMKSTASSGANPVTQDTAV
jgi:hypothetical protein